MLRLKVTKKINTFWAAPSLLVSKNCSGLCNSLETKNRNAMGSKYHGGF